MDNWCEHMSGNGNEGREGCIVNACYEIFGVAKHSETLESVAIYKSLYGEDMLLISQASQSADLKLINGRFFPLSALLASGNEIRCGKYRHFKGNDYDVIALATQVETLEAMVVYRQLYGEGALWVRPASMFADLKSLDGQCVPRFTFLGEALAYQDRDGAS